MNNAASHDAYRCPGRTKVEEKSNTVQSYNENLVPCTKVPEAKPERCGPKYSRDDSSSTTTWNLKTCVAIIVKQNTEKMKDDNNNNVWKNNKKMQFIVIKRRGFESFTGLV